MHTANASAATRGLVDAFLGRLAAGDLDGLAALHLAVDGGRIRRYRIYEDSLAVAEAWRAGGAGVAGGDASASPAP